MFLGFGTNLYSDEAAVTKNYITIGESDDFIFSKRFLERFLAGDYSVFVGSSWNLVGTNGDVGDSVVIESGEDVLKSDLSGGLGDDIEDVVADDDIIFDVVKDRLEVGIVAVDLVALLEEIVDVCSLSAAIIQDASLFWIWIEDSVMDGDRETVADFGKELLGRDRRSFS